MRACHQSKQLSKKSLAQRLAFFATLAACLLFVVAALNLFKREVFDFQVRGATVLGLILALHVLASLLLRRMEQQRKGLALWSLFYLGLGLTGNLFSLLVSLVLFTEWQNWGRRRHVGWKEVLRRLFRNPTAIMGLFFIVFLLAVSLYSGLLFDYRLAVENDYANTFQPPSLAYPFGTDEYGRDVFVRILFGARISLVVGTVATLAPILLGGLLGAIAGYYGRRADNLIMRMLDILYAIPGILLAIAIVSAFGASTMNLILALSIGGIPGYARMVRAQVLQLADAEFIEAARAIGKSSARIIWEDIIPNALSPVIVRATLGIGAAVLSTSALSYLGLGVQPPTPEWGNILKAGSEYLEFYPYLAIFPGLAIVAVVLAFNFFGDGLRDALDPKMK